MPEIPSDLVRLTDVLREHKPSRAFWDARIAAGPERGGIQAYTVPGERGIWLSRADVDRVLQPKPYEREEREA